MERHVQHPASRFFASLQPLREVRCSRGLTQRRKARKQLMLLSLILSSFLSARRLPSAQQLALLRKMPADLLRYTGGAQAGRRRHGRLQPGRVQEPRVPMRGDALSGPGRRARRSSGAWTRAGGRSTPRSAIRPKSGNFGRKGQPHGGPSAVAFWLAELDQAVLVLRESELGPKYKERIEPTRAEDSARRPGGWPSRAIRSG